MYNIGIYMDPINEIDFSKDSTVAIIKNLQRKAKIKLIIPDSIDYDSSLSLIHI